LSFPSAHAAFAFAFEVLDNWRAGRSNWPSKEKFLLGPGGVYYSGVQNIVTTALSVETIAARHDIKEGGISWFVLAFIDHPYPVEFIGRRKTRLNKAICDLCLDLQERGLIPRDPECSAGKRCKAGAKR